MVVNVPGVISVIVFYVLILAVGVWAGRKRQRNPSDPESEDVMLAGRNIGLFVGIFTMTGTFTLQHSNRLIDLLFPLKSFSHLGRRRLHQWYGRSFVFRRDPLVSGSVWLCFVLGGR